MQGSIWKETSLPSFPTLQGEEHTDVLIIGGGLCGVLCAYYLKEAGVDCLLLEAGRIGQGVSGNTTGKVTWLHGLKYAELLQKNGREAAQMYLAAGKDALGEYNRLAKLYDFDFEQRSACTYSLQDRDSIEAEAIALRALGERAEFSSCAELPFKTAGGIRVEGQGQLHIMKLLGSLIKDLPIFENSRVLDITPFGALTLRGLVRAKSIIVATHFPFVDRYGAFFLKQYQHRSYVLALQGAPKMRGMYVDAADTGLSFRPCGEQLLLGGGGHRTGKKGGGFAQLEHLAQKYFPEAKISASWATQDCMSLDSIAYIGNYSPKTPNIYVATGFNKWGMTSSMSAALIIRDRILGKVREYAPVFSPSRSMLHPQLLVNGLETLKNMLLPKTRRCSHLGCALHYNKAEHSWDCACHGSRFDEQGRVLDNPANKDANI